MKPAIWRVSRGRFGGGWRAWVRLAWYLFLVSGVLMTPLFAYLYWYPGDPPWTGTCLLTVYGTMLFAAMISPFFGWRRFLEAAGAVVLAVVMIFSGFYGLCRDVGFTNYVRTDRNFIQDHCRPVTFLQDGKQYQIGMCDVDMESDGQGGPSFVYDTSGDIQNDYDFDDLDKHRPDRREWVNAIRKWFNNDPNEAFEGADFKTTRMWGNFYDVYYNDADALGFTEEYGPPPPNSGSSSPP